MGKRAAMMMVLAAPAAAVEGDARALFEAWVAEHGKEYEEGEYAARFGVFSENLASIEAMNADVEDDATYEMNEFGDMTAEEFKGARLMSSHEAPSVDGSRFLEASKGGPSSFDWRDKGAVSPVRDQGSLGTCWIFSTVQNLEGQQAIKSGPEGRRFKIHSACLADPNHHVGARLSGFWVAHRLLRPGTLALGTPRRR